MNISTVLRKKPGFAYHAVHRDRAQFTEFVYWQRAKRPHHLNSPFRAHKTWAGVTPLRGKVPVRCVKASTKALHAFVTKQSYS